MNAGDFLHRYWSYLAIAAVLAIVSVASLFIAETLPPSTIVMATGAEGGANFELGLRYREILAQSGVKLELRPTTGSVENLARLRDPKSGVSVGFIQGGTVSKADSAGLESLGTVAYEPLWLFYRGEIGAGMQALRGRRVSIGPEGSGARALALELIRKTRFDTIVGEFSGLTLEDAATKLIAGDIDAAFIVASWDSPVVQRLINADGIQLTSFARADAYLALFPFLNKLVLPAGVVDLLTNRPPADILLLAPKASLVVRDDLHPALQHLLLDAASNIHSQPGIFQKAGQFPAAESIDIPLSDEAQRFYKSGLPFLQKYLPFWIATLVERMIVVFLPLAAFLYPMFKILPRLYDWFLRKIIIRLHDEMKSIEAELMIHGEGPHADAIRARLDQLDQRASRLSLPTALSLYGLRSNVALIRSRLATGAEKNAR
ncbi:MAG: TAXI family TRAP transporter solute-binding subunit [Xanthobacteraceae bacterium]